MRLFAVRTYYFNVLISFVRLPHYAQRAVGVRSMSQMRFIDCVQAVRILIPILLGENMARFIAAFSKNFLSSAWSIRKKSLGYHQGYTKQVQVY